MESLLTIQIQRSPLARMPENPLLPPEGTADVFPGSKALREWLESSELADSLTGILPKHIPVKRFLAEFMNAIRRKPKAAMCTKNSLMRCLSDLAKFGLAPDGVHAHLTVYEDEGKYFCEYILDYKGMVVLLHNSGLIKDPPHADCVYFNEVAQKRFWFRQGTDKHLHHEPLLTDRGDPVAYYVHIRFKDGGEAFHVMNLDEINRIRDESWGYRKAKAKNERHPWDDFHPPMAKKTVFKQMCKWLSLSADMQAALVRDFDDFPEKALPESTASNPASRFFEKAVTTDSTSTPPAESTAKTAPASQPSAPTTSVPETPPPPPPPAPVTKTSDSEIGRKLVAARISEDRFLAWARSSGLISTAATIDALASEDVQLLLSSWSQVLLAYSADNR